MYQEILVPRENPIITPDQLAVYGRWDCPEQYCGDSPPTVSLEYALIETFIEAATDEIENLAATACAPEQVLLSLDMFPNAVDPRVVYDYLLYGFDWLPAWWFGRVSKESIELVKRPVIVPAGSPPENDLVVNYYDPQGVMQTLDPASYTVFANKITLNVGYHWPATDRRQDCIQITYWAGYETVPSRLQLAVSFLANHFYSVRQIVSVEPSSEIHMTLCSLLKPYRSYRIAK